MSNSISEMVAKRRELDRQIRAAKRAEKKAADAALLAAQQSLGVWLTGAVGADNIEAIERLRTVMDGEHNLALRESLNVVETGVVEAPLRSQAEHVPEESLSW